MFTLQCSIESDPPVVTNGQTTVTTVTCPSWASLDVTVQTMERIAVEAVLEGAEATGAETVIMQAGVPIGEVEVRKRKRGGNMVGSLHVAMW